MKTKIKNVIHDVIDYTLTNEFKSFVMITLFVFFITGFTWAALSTAISKDLLNRLETLNTEYQELQAKNENLNSEYVRYKMMYEETYELFTSCIDTHTWYEDFYYDNVDPYTGEIDGEYYE